MPVRWALRRIGEFVVLVVCAPIVVLAVPVCIVVEAVQQRRRVRLGQETSHWRSPGVRVDLVVADVSRIGEGLVGVRRRHVSVREWTRDEPLAEYDAEVEFIPVARFRVPEPFFRRGWWRVTRTACVK